MQCYLSDQYSGWRMCYRCDISSKVTVGGEKGGPVYTQKQGGRSCEDTPCPSLSLYTGGRQLSQTTFLPLRLSIYTQKGGTLYLPPPYNGRKALYRKYYKVRQPPHTNMQLYFGFLTIKIWLLEFNLNLCKSQNIAAFFLCVVFIGYLCLSLSSRLFWV